VVSGDRQPVLVQYEIIAAVLGALVAQPHGQRIVGTGFNAQAAEDAAAGIAFKFIDDELVGLAPVCHQHDVALRAGLGAGAAARALVGEPYQFIAAYTLRCIQLLLGVLHGDGRPEQVLEGQRHTLGYAEAVTFKLQPCHLLM